MKTHAFILMLFALAIAGCDKKDDNTGAKLIFKYKMDPNQERLGNLGQPVAMPAGNAGQSPEFNGMSAHYIEMAPTAWTALTTGEILYHQQETSTGGSKAIVHSVASVKNSGEVFFEIPLKDVTPGTYEWLRVSLAYQNFDVKMRIDTTISGFSINETVDATVASFVGFNTYINSYKIKNETITVNANKAQGYWGFEYSMDYLGTTYKGASTGDAAVTTVPNPIGGTSPIPTGSCVVTGQFAGQNLVITGNETKDIVVEVSLSVNKSFEWQDLNPNGLWEPLKGENVVDMGLRGLIPRVVN